MISTSPVPSEVFDADRLAALDSYDILDTLAEEGFEDIVQLAARLCDVPVSLVSLVGLDRQWFKARVGFPQCQTDLDGSVCKFVLAEPDLLVIPDLTLDPRTRANTLVTGEPFIRFYAGAPLRTSEGHVLGSLCVIDREPRPEGLTRAQAEDLRRLARQTMAQMELRRVVAHQDGIVRNQRAELRRERRLSTLAETSVSLLTASDPASVLAPILKAEASYLGFDQSFTYDLSDDGSHLALTHSVGADRATHEALRRVSCDIPLCGLVATNGQPLILSDLQAGTDPRHAIARDAGLDAYAGYPIESQGKLRGVISFGSTSEASFDDETLSFFSTIARFLSVARERLDRESALRASEGRYRAIFESAIDYAIVVMNLDGEVTNWNEGATRILGWEPDDICGKPAEVFFTPEDRAAGIAQKEMHSALTVGRGVDERWHIRKSGERFWANGEMMALRDDADRAIGFIKILRDRTAQRLAAEQERASAAFTSSVLAASADCIKVLDLDANILFMSEGGLKALEIDDFNTVMGCPWPEFWQGPTRDDAKAAVDAAKAGGTGHFQGVADTMTGRPLWWDVQVTPIPGADGRPEKILSVSRDITRQKDADRLVADSEARWRGLFSGMVEGFFSGELIRGADGGVVDYRFLEINPAFAAQSGLSLETVGRRVREVIADVPQSVLDSYGRVVETGVPEIFEIGIPELGRTFEVRAYKETGQRFGAMFQDVTARKDTEARRTGLLELGDRLRDKSDRAEIVAIGSEILGRTLGLSHAGCGAVDHAAETIEIAFDHTPPGVASVAGTHRFRDYGSYIEDLKAGEIVLIEDTTRDRRTAGQDGLVAISALALANYPVMEQGRFVTLFFALKATPHAWSNEEVGFLRNVADRTRAAIARVEAEDQQRTLNLELSHRMKNMLAMVQSIATQTMRGAKDMETAKNVLADRLVALGRSHDLLLGGTLSTTPLADLIENAVKLHQDENGRFAIEGPPVLVGSKAALSLSLMLHELATNAAKYGALSNGKGRVAITWKVDATASEPQAHLRWMETGGPSVVAPTRTGFGTRLIGRGLAGSFGGEVDLSYPETGVICTITAPLRDLHGYEASVAH
ncbi:PAS domain-containing protein [Methylobacterium sp. J-088]|uniref:GAF domain-containing protein n=1 Tax=Methylobacterium sp. J-088 TaxID=2836664 RepID=UPI001FBB899D|nr:GAF domain-containing protein [Methylobacterium sp. J-088]MCJ2066002.1 PAS domain-containing protein [Methylobacterium sp. J-088]